MVAQLKAGSELASLWLLCLLVSMAGMYDRKLQALMPHGVVHSGADPDAVYVTSEGLTLTLTLIMTWGTSQPKVHCKLCFAWH